jgi:hypothetical protein
VKFLKVAGIGLGVLGVTLGWVVAPVSAQEEAPTGLERRVDQLESAVEERVGGDGWLTSVEFSGLIEVEAGHEETSFDAPGVADEDSNDVDLATVEFGIDAQIAPHVTGSALFLYEGEDVTVDEGFITLEGGDVFPGYLVAGKMYVPFGGYESHFVADPLTLELGETGEGAAMAGVVLGDDLVDISVSAFNGKAQEAGDDEAIDSFVAAVVAAPTDFLALGVSYTSNLGGSDGLSEVLTAPDALDSMVGGWCAFATVTLADRITLLGEYLGAIEEFKAGELYAEDDGKERQPAAWNVELGVAILDNLEVAGRYGGSEDGADFLAETQYGGVINWGVFDNTNLALEYIHGDFEDDVQETDTFTAQLAVEF